MRAKFHTQSVTNHSDGNTSVVLNPVLKGADDSENAQFWKYTPNGKLEMYITNPNAKEFFKPGSDYYLDFTPVE